VQGFQDFVLDLTVSAARRATGKGNLKAFHVYGGSELPEQFTRKVRKPVAFLVPSASGS